MIPNRIFKDDPVIEIKRKRGNALLFSIALMGMSAYGALMWIDVYLLKKLPDDGFDFIAAVCLPLFLIPGIFITRKIFDKRPAVTLSPEGISNYSNATSFALVRWNEIERFGFYTIRGASLIYIYVDDPAFFIRQTSGISFLLMKIGSWVSDTPLVISTDVLDCNVNDLVETLNYKLEKYRYTT